MKSIVNLQKSFFFSEKTKDYSFRKKQLLKLKKMLVNYESSIYGALKSDLNKSKEESFTTEIGILHTEIDFSLKHLKSWMKEKEVAAPLTHKGTQSYIIPEPYGVTLVISPWNYPIQLALAPAIGAIAAGNTVVLKPSELTPHSSSLLKDMIENTFEDGYFKVVEGDKTVSEKLLNERFDYIFFTGSTDVGKIIMKQASNHLTPLTLELGGKSPVIIDKDANIKLSARRVAWGKFTNAGQTCVAPDYVYVHQRIKDKFMKALKKEISSLYGKDPLENKNYVRIVSERHYERLTSFLKDGNIVHGGMVNRNKLLISPTVLDEVTWDNPVMQDEIFGPILPIFTFEKIDEVITKVRENEKPLALYYFGGSNTKQQKIIQTLSFGGGCINDTLYHLANPHLPFGGVGSSGIGSYHGKYSFDTFSHQKSILKQTTLFDIPLRYPGGKISHGIVKKLMK